MTPTDFLATYGLKSHPFPPAATGVAFAEEMWIPETWETQLRTIFDELSSGLGTRATAVVGTYGSGKTYLLHWMMEHWFKDKSILPFYIGNPGLAFYALADEVFRQLGRYEFSKAVWQALVDDGGRFMPQGSLFGSAFPNWLQSLSSGAIKEEAQRQLSEALLDRGLADEGEVSYRFAQIIVGTRDRPYYTFRDFVPRSSTSMVAERQEPRYFATLVRILQYAYGVSGVAFLLDEFEDVALGKRLPRRQLAEYFSTLRQLLDVANEEQFWLVLSITPEGWDSTYSQEPALLDRFGPKFDISILSNDDAIDLVQHRLATAREDETSSALWPFEDDAVSSIQPANRTTPRMLVKIFWLALAEASRAGIKPPISTTYVLNAERRLSDEV